MEPRFCPQCGQQETLLDDAEHPLATAERGCYDGTTYCFVGPLPTLRCGACGFRFAIDVAKSEEHATCNCEGNALCTCGRYRNAKALRTIVGDPPLPPSDPS